MRIAFMGKGGSGKTTLTGGFIKHIQQKHRNKEFLVIDADINVHLQQLLNIKGKPYYLGNLQSNIQEYVMGNRNDLEVGIFPPTSIPTTKSQFVFPRLNDAFLQSYSLIDDNIALLTIGKFENSDVGHSCYHGKLNSLEIFFHHLLDNNQDLVITDAVTGIDNFGTSLWFCYDLNIFVVEPTKKSLSVFFDYKTLANKNGVNYKVVINKIYNQKDIDFIYQNIDKDEILGSIEHSNNVREREQGDSEAFDEFVLANQDTWNNIENHIFGMKKNWDLYLKRLRKCHFDNCTEWRNDYYKKDFINNDAFNYNKILCQI